MIIDKDFEQIIIADLKERLTEEKFRHSLSTAKTAVKLAEQWGGDKAFIEKCYLAGLVHDCGKLKDMAAIIYECKRYSIPLTEEDLLCPHIIHSYLSEAIAREEYKIKDIEILKAVRNHTLGSNEMTLIEKIVFIADKIEPERGSAEKYQRIREKAYENIDEAVLLTYRNAIEYNREKNRYIHKDTFNNMNALKENIK